jgi:hypothetical protein
MRNSRSLAPAAHPIPVKIAANPGSAGMDIAAVLSNFVNCGREGAMNAGRHTVSVALACAFLWGCASAETPAPLAAGYGGYSGNGGMAAYDIKPNVYEYHYDHGFTGSDAMGWNPNLQFAWSRIAAAIVCGVPVSTGKVIPHLIKKFKQDKMTHELNGIGFHSNQIRANKQFCTKERVVEVKSLVPQFESGHFPDKF